jgi:serine/threonine protein kinase
MPDPGSDFPRKGAVGDKTSQRCEGCGEMYSQESSAKHLDCNYSMANFQATPPAPAPGESDRTIVYSESSKVDKSNPGADAAKRKPGDPNWPEEVRNAAREPKNLLNQYILVAQIGKGGMGTVWKAFDRSLLRWVAIKFLTSSDGNEEGVLRFKREAQLAGGLRHPNIAPIYEVGEARGQHFIAMEFIDGASMANAQLPMKDMCDIFIKVALGIEAAHKKGIIHRDLKPQNIMLTSDNWPYVMDFGLAKALRGDSSLSVTGAVMGTPAYMPPEQAQGKLELIDHQSDVYSLGATMYAILSRKTPFQAETAMDILMKVCNEEPIPPRKHNAEIPADIETIILKAMQKKKEDRYGSAQDLADDLKRFVSNEEIQATRPGFLTHVIRKAKRNKSAAIMAVVLAGVVVVVGGVLMRPKPAEQRSGGSGDGGGESAEVREARDKWKKDWLALSGELGYETWKPGQNPKLAENAIAHLKDIEAKQVSSDTVQSMVISWYQSELSRAKDDVKRIFDNESNWGRDRDQVIRAQNWCSQAAALVNGLDLLKTHAAVIPDILRMGERITDYKGTFTIRVVVGPYADWELKRGGKVIKSGETPAREEGLDVAEYTLVLKHAEHGTHEIPLKDMIAAKTYLVTGLMSDKSSIKVTPQ